MAWLLRDGEVLASLEIADGLVAKTRGLLGRDGVDGAMLLKVRSVHTIGMKFPIDVAFCDRDLVVLDTKTLAPHRLGLPRRHGSQVIEARAGAFDQWKLRPGDRLEIKGG
jgi:uncharacterized membrane protein (UPF0127 family)